MSKHTGPTTFRLSILQAGIGCLATIGVLLVIASTSTCNAQENEPPKQEKSVQELRLQFAKLSLKLAETELQLAEQFNRELEQSFPTVITGTLREKALNMKRISDTSIERLKSNVAMGRAQLELANSPSTGNPEKLRIRYADEKIRLAKVNLDAAKADKLRGKKIPKLQIVREDLKYQLALLNRELLSNPEHLATLVDSLQRQIDQLREDMIRQDQRIIAVEDQGIKVDR